MMLSVCDIHPDIGIRCHHQDGKNLLSTTNMSLLSDTKRCLRINFEMKGLQNIILCIENSNTLRTTFFYLVFLLSHYMFMNIFSRDMVCKDAISYVTQFLKEANPFANIIPKINLKPRKWKRFLKINYRKSFILKYAYALTLDSHSILSKDTMGYLNFVVGFNRRRSMSAYLYFLVAQATLWGFTKYS